MVKIYLYVKTCGDEKCLVISLKCTEILIGMPCHFIKGFFIFYIGTKIRLKIMFFALDLLWNRKSYICYYAAIFDCFVSLCNCIILLLRIKDFIYNNIVLLCIYKLWRE